MKFKNLFGFGKLTALGFTQEDAQGHETLDQLACATPTQCHEKLEGGFCSASAPSTLLKTESSTVNVAFIHLSA